MARVVIKSSAGTLRILQEAYQINSGRHFEFVRPKVPIMATSAAIIRAIKTPYSTAVAPSSSLMKAID
jgi:hypothetical protein